MRHARVRVVRRPPPRPRPPSPDPEPNWDTRRRLRDGRALVGPLERVTGEGCCPVCSVCGEDVWDDCLNPDFWHPLREATRHDYIYTYEVYQFAGAREVWFECRQCYHT